MEFRNFIKDKRVPAPYMSNDTEVWVDYYLQVIALYPDGYTTAPLSSKQRYRLYALFKGKLKVTRGPVTKVLGRSLFVRPCCSNFPSVYGKGEKSHVNCCGGCTAAGSQSMSIGEALKGRVMEKRTITYEGELIRPDEYRSLTLRLP